MRLLVLWIMCACTTLWSWDRWLGEELLIRPEDRVVEDHIWTPVFACRPAFRTRGLYVQELGPFFRTKETTTIDRGYALDATLSYPFGRCRALTGRLAGGWVEQENDVTGATNYQATLYQAGIGAQLKLGCWGFMGDLLAKGASGDRTAPFPFRDTVRLEPNGVVFYSTPHRCLLLAGYLDSFVVRDPIAIDSYLLTREHILLKYEYRLAPPHRAFGVQGHVLHYDAPNNWEERTSVWFRTGFPQLESCLFFRYQFDYRRFSRIVPQYLSFNHRVLHAGVFTYTIPICRCGRLYLEAIYGWMRSRELNDPIQQTNEQGQIVPVVLFKQTANITRFRGRYTQRIGKLALGIAGTYYWDAIHYQAWRLEGRASYCF